MTILIFVVILSVLVLVHELGHFLAAKFFKMRVDEFAIGFPPKVWSVKRGETEYKINLLPLGGYVKIFGENPDEEYQKSETKSGSMHEAAKWKQIIVLVAGVSMNILLAWFILTSLTLFGRNVLVSDSDYPQFIQDDRIEILQVVPDSPADRADIKTGDQILSVSDGEKTIIANKNRDELRDFIAAHNDSEVTFKLKRADGHAQEVKAKPQIGIVADDSVESERALVGIALDEVGTLRLPLPLAIVDGAKQTVFMLRDIFVGLGRLIIGKVNVGEVTGPVGLVRAVGQAQALGFSTLMMFVVVISLNLAVMNLLPIPALDGGRIFFVLIEMISRRSLPPTVLAWIHGLGFVFLMGLMLLVTISDVIKLF